MKLIIVLCIVCFFTSHTWSNQFDPMAPPGFAKGVKKSQKKTVKTRTRYILSQIMVRPNGNQAMINDEIVTTGSYVKSARVVKVEPNKVVLDQSGKRIVLVLEYGVPKVRHE